MPCCQQETRKRGVRIYASSEDPRCCMGNSYDRLGIGCVWIPVVSSPKLQTFYYYNVVKWCSYWLQNIIIQCQTWKSVSFCNRLWYNTLAWCPGCQHHLPENPDQCIGLMGKDWLIIILNQRSPVELEHIFIQFSPRKTWHRMWHT